MKKSVIKLLVFVVVFLVSLVGISAFMNMGNMDMTAEMRPATLPTICILSGTEKINRMHGYTTKMEEASVRETITPLDAGRQINAQIETYGQAVESAAYEVRSVDGSRLIENTPLSLGTEVEGHISLSFRVKDLIREGEEYSLTFLLTLRDGREVRYYTRILQAEYQLQAKLDFIREFHEATFDPEALKAYTRYMEPNSTGNNSSLARVNIHCSLRQVAWRGLAVRKVTQPCMLVREISPQTASVTMSYVVSYPMNDRQVEALVEEYYRVRYTPERMYLLDYERTMEQVFGEDGDSFVNDKVSLGITDSDVTMQESDGGGIFAFVSGKVLYSYSGADGKLARLFSFADGNRRDERNLYGNHMFRILQVEETGNVTFLVAGYMNRGRHEGECGVQVMYYSSTLNVTEELVFIPSHKAARLLAADIDKLAYVNGKNDLFLMLNGNIYHVGLEDKSLRVVAKNLNEEEYRVAADQSMVVWEKEGSDRGSLALVLMNLNSGIQTEIPADMGDTMKPLGFMGKDLIYGVARHEDVKENNLGYLVFPMYRIVIQGENGAVLKNYEQTEVYVTDCTVEENQILLTRVRKEGDYYTAANPDQIMYNAQIAGSRNYVETVVTENLGAVVQIVVKNVAEDKKMKLLTPKEVLFEGKRVLSVEEETVERYYVYGKKGIIDAFFNPTQAILLANENAGTVTDNGGNYIWKRDRLHSSNQIMAITGESGEEGESSLAVCLNAILQFNGQMRDSAWMLENGKDALQILQEGLPERKILDLKGCSLDMVLYYPDREIPVLAVLQDGNALLITGFNDREVVIMDPRTGTLYKEGINNARNMFAENGNLFVAYW